MPAEPKILTVYSLKETFADAWPLSRHVCKRSLGFIPHLPELIWISRYRVIKQAADHRERALTVSMRTVMIVPPRRVLATETAAAHSTSLSTGFLIGQMEALTPGLPEM